MKPSRYLLLFLSLIFAVDHSFSHEQSNSPIIAPQQQLNENQVTAWDRVKLLNSQFRNAKSRIVQDRTGYLWFSFENKLYRYNGYNFKVYAFDPADPYSLSDGLINDLCLDSNGSLWVGTIKGQVDRYEPSRDRFHHYIISLSSGDSMEDCPVEDIYTDREGRLWIGTSSAGLLRYNSHSDEFEVINGKGSVPFSLNECSVLQIYEDSHSGLWLSIKGIGLVVLEKSTGVFRSYGTEGGVIIEVPAHRDANLYEDSRGIIWVWTWGGGLFNFDRETSDLKALSSSETDNYSEWTRFINCVREDKEGNLWFGTRDSGLVRYRPESRATMIFTHDPANPKSLSSNNITYIFEDESETIWVSSSNGLDRFSKFKYKFRNSYHPINTPGEGMAEYITALCQDRKETLWIGTIQGNLLQYIEEQEELRPVKLEQFGIQAGDNIFSILENRQGQFYLGTAANGLYRLDNGLNRVERITEKQHIADILEDRSGDLWLATHRYGLGHFTKDQEIFSYWQIPEADNTGTSLDVTTLYEDWNGNLWVGTDGKGLYCLSGARDVYQHFRHEKDNEKSLSDDRILCIHEDSTGFIWIGTLGGLNRLDPEKRTIKRFFEQDGLPDNVICGIVSGSEGTIWFSCTKGLGRFDPHTGEFHSYDTENGLVGFPFSPNAYIKTNDGELVFGGLNGFCKFHPDRLEINQHKPNIVVTKFRIFEREMKFPYPTDRIRNIRLSYDENFFSFEFAALDFADPEHNRYAYMLEGLDKEWIQSGNRRYAIYTKVPPGNYIFKVKGSNNDGLWNDAGSSIEVIVVPPFWMTYEFRFFTALMLVLSIIIVFRARTRSIKKQRNRLQIEVDERIKVEQNLRANQSKLRSLASELTLAQERERQRISVALHDRIGHALLLTKVGLMSHAKGDEKGKQRQPLDNLIETVNTAMKDARSLVVEISPPSLHKLGLESAVESLVEKIGAENGLKTLVLWKKRSPIEDDVAVLLYQAVRELLVNTIKHAEASMVKISMHNDGERMILKLQDNGKGFDYKRIEQDDDDFKGYGLFSIRERMETVGGMFIIRSEPGKGTEMKLITPLKTHSEEEC